MLGVETFLEGVVHGVDGGFALFVTVHGVEVGFLDEKENYEERRENANDNNL